jgi:hypothetical protein
MANASATTKNMQEAFTEAGTKLSIISSGMIVTKIINHIELLSTNIRNGTKKCKLNTCNKEMVIQEKDYEEGKEEEYK